MKYLSNYELYLKRRHCHNLILIYGTYLCFAKFWPFYLRHQQCYISGMQSGYVQWKKNTGFKQTSCSLYLISIYFDYLLGLNKIPCLLYEQLFIYKTICFKYVVQIVISYHCFFFNWIQSYISSYCQLNYGIDIRK